MSRLERKKSIIGFALVGFAILLMGVLIFQNLQANLDRESAQSSAAVSAQQKKSLAEEVADACQSGQVIKSVAGVDLCARAATIAQQPVTIEGPAGPEGPRGLPGTDGAEGIAGASGPAGKPGTNGTNGEDGQDGVPGLPGSAGADGTAGPMGPPGPAGKDSATGPKGDTGDPGPAGANGTGPESFTFADALGHTYNCEPDPPGSATYTCTTQPANPPGG
ncbi:hypothetical protein AAFM46_11060 [Arthrobacter sp. TMP15]|uniref:hypothetical protein n=1 Tax=Arthrobacter sp. TMP15 TaxID=3140789 RepID=UPI0031BACB1C